MSTKFLKMEKLNAINSAEASFSLYSAKLNSMTISQIKETFSSQLPNKGWKTLKKDDLISYVKTHLSSKDNSSTETSSVSSPTSQTSDLTQASLTSLEIDFSHKLSFVEVCAGAGGLSSGLMKAGFHPVMLNDISKDACESLRLNHPSDCLIEHKSFLDIDWTPYIDKLDLLTGGTPCQNWSSAGNREGDDGKSGCLFRKFLDVIHQVKPKTFLIENVKGMTNLKDKEGNSVMKQILNLFISKGLYEVQYAVLNANDYGVPQSRERVFIVGTLKVFEHKFIYPVPMTTSKLVLRDVLLPKVEAPHSKYSEKRIEVFKLIPEGQDWSCLSEEQLNSLSEEAKKTIRKFKGVYHRLDSNKPSPTLLTSPSHGWGDKCHPWEERTLNLKEYARIQTFPDDYKFSGSMTSVYEQIGNAVPVELAYHVGLSLKKFLSKTESSE